MTELRVLSLMPKPPRREARRVQIVNKRTYTLVSPGGGALRVRVLARSRGYLVLREVSRRRRGNGRKR